MQSSPDHIAPACPMPETTGEKSHKQIKIPSYPPAPVPSQRNIDIIPEPGTQRYMPPVPEVGNAHCKVRRVEIFHEIKPHNSRCTDSHRAVSRKVTVDLERKSRRSQHKLHRSAGINISEYGVHKQCKPVRYHHLLKQPPHHQHKTGCDPVIIPKIDLIHAAQLFQETARTFYRASHQLRKKRNKQGIPQQIFLRLRLPSVDVDQIPQRLEGIKGYPHRQQKTERIINHCQMKHLQYFVQIIQEKPEILKEKQNSQVTQKTARQNPFLCSAPLGFRKQQSAKPCNKR